MDCPPRPISALIPIAFVSLVTACVGSPAPVTEDMVVEASVDQLQAWMASGRLTSRALTEIYLSRIDRYDRHGPRINSLLEVNPRALTIADSLDRERRGGRGRGPLFGIPVVVKDAMATADLMRTSNGAYWLMDATPTTDATVVAKLREAGALILAKSNMDEMACCNGIHSGRGGGVRNPYDPDRFASGSSSGSAASVAANLAVLSLGGDTRSSIRFPASVTSLVGLKPTMGLISRAGVIPGDIHLDVVGPLARTVTDVTIVTGVLAGPDDRDPYTRAAADSALTDYRPFLIENALQGVRLGIAREGFFGLNPAIDSVMEVALSELQRAGAVLVDSIVIEAIPFAGGRDEDARVLDNASALALDQYLRALTPDSPVRSFAQLRAELLLGQYPTGLDRSGLRFAAGVDVDVDSLPRYSLDSPEVRNAFQQFLQEQRDLVMTQMDGHDLAAIVFPTTSTLTGLILPSARVPDTPSRSRGRPEIANYAGLPELTVPAGYTSSGFPVGMSLLGPAFSEGTLLGLGYAFEQATHHRRPPDLSRVPSPVDPWIPAVPANDAFADRTALTGTSGSMGGNLLLASVEVDEPRTSARGIDRTVWFSFTPDRSGELILDDVGSAPARLDLVVYDGGARLDRLGRAARARRDRDLNAMKVSLAVRAGATYPIVVGAETSSMAGGTFVLNWRLEAR